MNDGYYSSKRKRKKPGEAGIEVIIDEHLAGSFSLRLPFLGENGEVGTTLDPAFGVPRALPVPHQHHPLRHLQRRERRLRAQSRMFRLLLFYLLHAAPGASECHVSGRVRLRDRACGMELMVIADNTHGRTTGPYYQNHLALFPLLLLCLTLSLTAL